MPDSGVTPVLADIYLLDKQLRDDRSRSLEQLQERDHAIGRECVGASDADSLLHWLQSVLATSTRKSTHWLNEASAALLLRLFALVAGATAMGGFLLASERALVNVFLLLAFFVLLPLVLALVSAWVMLLSARGSPPAVSALNPARFVARWALPEPGYLKSASGLSRLLIVKYAQDFALLFSLGVMVAFLLLLTFNDFSFVWGSTFGFSDAVIANVTAVLAAPWSSLLPAATVTPEIISETRYHAAQLDLGPVAAASRRGWWPFLLLCLATYTLLPRLLLWFLARRSYRRGLIGAFLSLPGAASVLARMRAPVVKTRALEADHEDSLSSPVIREEGAVLLEWAGALSGTAVQWEVARELAAGLGSPGDDVDSIDTINQLHPPHLLVAVKGWEPPMADLADVLAEIREVDYCTLQLVPLAGRELGESAFRDWQAFAARLPFRVTDVVALGGAGQ
ncbi:DUF2868 domain-containing protein [Seongchinamella sediminis]|uniref:DUF2868 domain-containing protein n=1 Tax=Seongchinamella sediminis TaxID=2283635 RepID=A0A3L7E1L8_9GAMM|nr:DUF2868 domain-containing protein [Seongchinamella sediminis]RLQ22580.1 DUF2868 domain-containing protein [Seongchinamella sediminis]